ncbi:MAG: CBS domain-containing protein [Gammaproteobacteria bacterium]|nr:CBS domain-containing protein [Gammaproteobacteria bacterium]
MSEMKRIPVEEVMSDRYETVDRMVTVVDGLRKMKRKKAEALIVDRRHEDDEYGIVLFSDIARKVLAKDRAADRVNIYEIMSKPVITVNSDMDIRYCARLFDNFGLSCAPVVTDGNLVGIVSYADMVLRGFCAQLTEDD